MALGSVAGAAESAAAAGAAGATAVLSAVSLGSALGSVVAGEAVSDSEHELFAYLRFKVHLIRQGRWSLPADDPLRPVLRLYG